jgi:HSP20 family molecular chaperone IbpA
MLQRWANAGVDFRGDAMKHSTRIRKAIAGATHQENCETLREQIPLSDMSDCLLAVYDEVSRRAFQRCIVRGEQEGSDREDWKAAEEDLFARIPVDFEESGGNLYAMASLPGCAGTQITVAVDECWLLICGYASQNRRSGVADDSEECASDDAGVDSGSFENDWDFQAVSCDASGEMSDYKKQIEISPKQSNDHDGGYSARALSAPRPFCVVALRAKVDPGRSVAVLSNGLLAIRMGKAGLEKAVPRVA